jgi:hypothetical protein
MAGTLGVDLEELIPLTMKRRFCATGLIKQYCLSSNTKVLVGKANSS